VLRQHKSAPIIAPSCPLYQPLYPWARVFLDISAQGLPSQWKDFYPTICKLHRCLIPVMQILGRNNDFVPTIIRAKDMQNVRPTGVVLGAYFCVDVEKGKKGNELDIRWISDCFLYIPT
jgi:hypothetical protein